MAINQVTMTDKMGASSPLRRALAGWLESLGVSPSHLITIGLGCLHVKTCRGERRNVGLQARRQRCI